MTSVTEEQYKVYKIIKKAGVKPLNKDKAVKLSNALVRKRSEFFPHSSLSEDDVEECIKNHDTFEDRFEFDEEEIERIAEEIK